MSLGCAPSIGKLSKDGCLHEIVQRLPSFCRATRRKGNMDEELFGLEALSRMVSTLANHRGAEKLDLAAVTPFVVYRWILLETLKSFVDGMVAEAVQKCGGNGASLPSASSPPPHPPTLEEAAQGELEGRDQRLVLLSRPSHPSRRPTGASISHLQHLGSLSTMIRIRELLRRRVVQCPKHANSY